MEIRLRDIFFQLLRIGLWGKESLTLTAPLSETDWIEIRSYAIHHTVEGLIYDSFSYLKENQLPPQALRLKWTIRIDQIERHNAKMNEVIAMQYTAFTKLGLKPILQKGQGVAACYAIPEHRISGDIDWYFEENGYAKARQMLKDKNLNFTDTHGFSLDYDWKNIHVEHHKKLFDIRSPLKQRFLKNLQVTYKDQQGEVIINEVAVRTLAPELQLLQVNAHILKHLISFGIGLRQLCDSARLYQSLSSKIDSNNLKDIYRKSGIFKWTHLLHQLLVKYLGLAETFIPFPYIENIDADLMMDEIWHSGSFGYNDKRYENGKKSFVSTHPEGASRLWASCKRYYRYAPQEVLFFPIVHIYSKILGIDRD